VPDPDERVAVHKAVPPTVKATVPVGVPPVPDTVAEYATDCPEGVEVGCTDAEVVDGVGSGPLTEETTVPPPPQLMPAAKQFVADTQETPSS
jgi:hypothetical protein